MNDALGILLIASASFALGAISQSWFIRREERKSQTQRLRDDAGYYQK